MFGWDFVLVILSACGGTAIGWELRAHREVFLRNRERGRLREILAAHEPRDGQRATAPQKGRHAAVRKVDLSRANTAVSTKKSQER